MKTLWFLLCLCLIPLGNFAQKPQLNLMAEVGKCYGYVRYPDAYSSIYDWRHWHAAFDLGFSFKLTEKLVFSPEVGLQYFDMHYEYRTSSGDSRSVVSNMDLFYARYAPGITFHPETFFSIRMGLDLLGSVLTLGEYQVKTFFSWPRPDEITTYTSNFSRIRTPLVVGPTAGFGIHIPIRQGSHIDLRFTGMLAMNKLFKADFGTPYNPRIARLSLGLGYTFPKGTDEE